MLLRLRAWLGSAVVVAACGFDSSGHGNEAAEIGDSADPDASADDDAAPTGDGSSATTVGGTGVTHASASTSTTNGDTAGPEDSGSAVGDALDHPQAVVELNTEYDDEDPWLSSQGELIVFTSDRDGSMDLFSAAWAPL